EGAVLVDAPAFRVEPGAIHAVVGPNGSGKSTLLREIYARATRRAVEVAVGSNGHGERVLLLPQDGGGFSHCSVAETLHLAARRGRGPAQAAALADAWLRRLGLESFADRRCAELSAGQRRLV